MKRVFGDYEATKVLGKGSFGTVYLAVQRSTQRQVALKEVPEANLSDRVKARLDMEINCQQAIQSEYVVALLDSFTLRSGQYIALEYCAGGDLDKFLKKNGPVSESIAQKWMQQLACGLKELKSKKIMHRDLKLQNILLTAETTSAAVKLADFGMSKVMDEDLTTTRLGSPIYMAPEMFVPEAKYDIKADVWSLGIVFYQMVTGELPLEAKFKAEIPMAQRSLKPVPVELSECCKDLITRMLAYESTQRISFEEIFTHPFICPPVDQRAEEAPVELVQSSNSGSFDLVDEEIEEQQSEGESPLTRSQTDIEAVVKSMESDLHQAELVGKVISYVESTKEVLGLFALALKRTEMLKLALERAENVCENSPESLHPAFYTAKSRLWQAFSHSLSSSEAYELDLTSHISRKGLPACTTLAPLSPLAMADCLLSRYGWQVLSEASVDEYVRDYAASSTNYALALDLLALVGEEPQEGRKRLKAVQIVKGS